MRKSVLLVLMLVIVNLAKSQTLLGYSYYDIKDHVTGYEIVAKDKYGVPSCVAGINVDGHQQMFYVDLEKMAVFQSVIAPNGGDAIKNYILSLDKACIKLQDNYWIDQALKQLCHMVRSTDGTIYFIWTELNVTDHSVSFPMIGKTLKELKVELSEEDIKIDYYPNSQSVYIVTSHSGYGDVIKYYFNQYTGFIYAMILLPKNALELENYKKQYDIDYMKTYDNKWVDKGKLEIGELYYDDKYNTKYFIWRSL